PFSTCWLMTTRWASTSPPSRNRERLVSRTRAITAPSSISGGALAHHRGGDSRPPLKPPSRATAAARRRRALRSAAQSPHASVEADLAKQIEVAEHLSRSQ